MNNREFRQHLAEMVARQNREADEIAKKPPASERLKPKAKRKAK